MADLKCSLCGHTTTYGDASLADKHGCNETGGKHEWVAFEQP